MLRPFNPLRDRESTRRIWNEIGWLETGKEEIVDRWVDAGRALVSEVGGEAECLVCTAPGNFNYLDKTLHASLVTGVTTSRVARKQGLALRATAQAVAEDVMDGAIVAALGMFDQGFYNRLGFGTGSYELSVAFDPALLNIQNAHRIPQRLTSDDWELVHAARLARPTRHGQCTVINSVGSWGPMTESSEGFGLGYRDASTGELTHHFWGRAKGEHGPYRILWFVYHNRDQFLELMSVLQSIGDQVRAVKMPEPQGIQLQDLMKYPFKQAQISQGSKYAAGITAKAYFQYRICNLERCLAQTQLPGIPVRFNLELSDPIADYLPDDSLWRGVSGSYVITLGTESTATRGQDTALPTLKTTVNAFTRLWLGVRPASGLALTDDLVAPHELIKELDQLLRLPTPRNDWDF